MEHISSYIINVIISISDISNISIRICSFEYIRCKPSSATTCSIFHSGLVWFFLLRNPTEFYPLLNVHISLIRSTIFNGWIHYTWPFSIANCQSLRVFVRSPTFAETGPVELPHVPLNWLRCHDALEDPWSAFRGNVLSGFWSWRIPPLDVLGEHDSIHFHISYHVWYIFW